MRSGQALFDNSSLVCYDAVTMVSLDFRRQRYSYSGGGYAPSE